PAVWRGLHLVVPLRAGQPAPDRGARRPRSGLAAVQAAGARPRALERDTGRIGWCGGSDLTEAPAAAVLVALVRRREHRLHQRAHLPAGPLARADRQAGDLTTGAVATRRGQSGHTPGAGRTEGGGRGGPGRNA